MSEPVNNTTGSQKQVTPVESVPKAQQVKMIQPAVNKTAETKTEVKTTTNLENNSIINQKQNELPSLKEEPKSHKQNYPTSNNTNQKPKTQIITQGITINQPQPNPTPTQSAVKPTSKTQIPPQQTTDSNKIIPSTQAPKTIPSQTKIQSSKPPQVSATKNPQIKPVESVPKTQQPQTIKQIQTTNTEKSTQKSSKDVPLSSKEIKKEEPQPVQKPNEKGSQKISSQKKVENQKAPQKTKNQQLQKPITQQAPKQVPASTKVIDSLEKASIKQPEQTKKKQLQPSKRSQKQIIPKQESTQIQKTIQKQQLPQSEEGISFNQLLKSLLQKCKQKQQKAKARTQQNPNTILQDIETDLNLSLASSSQPTTSYPQNRLKLQFKLLQKNPQTKSEPANVLQTSQAEHNQPKQQAQSNITKEITDKKPSDFKVAFYMFNLKEPKSRDNNENQKQKIKSVEIIQKKLEELTNSFDRTSFSLKVTEKDQFQQQKNKLPLKTIKLNFQPPLISTLFGIKPQRLQELHTLLNNLEQKPQKKEIPKSENPEPNRQGQIMNKQILTQKVSEVKKKLQKNSAVSFTTSAEITLSESLKNIESSKFLSWLSNGFKMRLQSRKDKQFSSLPHFLQKALREATFSLAPSLLTDYLSSVSSGTANIKFRSIKDLRKLLTRLGINEIFDQTPTTKEIIKDLIQVQLKSLFKVKQKAQKEVKTQEKVKQKGENLKETSEMWKVVKAVFCQANCQGLSIEITLYQRFAIRLTIECCSKNISQIWAEVLK